MEKYLPLHFLFLASILMNFIKRIARTLKNSRPALLLFILLFAVHHNISAQVGITRIYSDFNGFWTSADRNISPIQPDNRHNLLAFTWKAQTYSTGVNDAILEANGVAFTKAVYQAFPVANVTLNGLKSNFVGLGSMEDRNPAGGRYPYSVPVKISDILTRGVNGLDLGSCITNIPATADALTFNFSTITEPTQIGDNVPDILISQVASPGGSNPDKVWFEDANHTIVGNVITINMFDNNVVPRVADWHPDFYSPVNGDIGLVNQVRPIRIWAADVSLFGIDMSNYTRPLYLRYKLGGDSDPAFIAFNSKFIDVINANDDSEFTEVGTPVNIDVLDNDGPKAALDPASMVISEQPANGTVEIRTVNGVRVIHYTPNPGFSGFDMFKYRVCNVSASPQCDDAIVELTVGSADVQIIKTASTLTPFKGGQITFTLVAKNNGPGTALNVKVTDVLPTGYTFIPPGSPNYNNVTGIWSIPSLNANASETLTINATVKPAGIYTNTATISSSTIDLVEGNNSSSVTPVPTLMADLEISKTADLQRPDVGGLINFTLTAKNNGPGDATSVVVTDLLPDGYLFESTTATAKAYNPSTGRWTVGTLAGNATATISIRARVKAAGNYTNTATISGAQPDNFPENNSATFTPDPQPVADLSLTKSVNQASPEVGANIVFTVNVTNNGPSSATAVKVKDLLPDGYILISASPSSGTYNATTGEWLMTSLANGITATLSISATVKAQGPYLNTATATAATGDPDLSNNTATATIAPIPLTDLEVTKTAVKDIIHNGGSVNPGDVETFTITVTNNGPSAATGVTATDRLPTGYTYLTHGAATGTSYNPASAIWTIGNLSNGQTVVLTINATIRSSGNYVNTVRVTGQQKDPDLSNNEAAYPLANSSANVGIEKRVSPLNPNVGTNVIFTLRATNAATSSSDATQVTVNDILPSGYTYVSSSATTGSYNPANGIWYIGNLIKNRSAVLSITAKVNPQGNYTNTAEVTAALPDPVPENNSSSATTVPLPLADLAIEKTLDQTTLNNGSPVFKITVTNNGPSEASGVSINDPLPNGYTYTSSNATTGTYNSSTGIWTFSSLPVGATEILTLNTTLNASGPFLNTATVNSAVSDPDPANNTASASPVPLAPTGHDMQTFCAVNNPKVSDLYLDGTAIKWYAAVTGGTSIAANTALVNARIYYATQTIAGAESADRFAVTVTITTTPSPGTIGRIQTFCESSGATVNDLQVTGTDIKWYNAATGGIVLPLNTPLINGTLYYATQVLDGCESKIRREILAVITSTAAPAGDDTQYFCEISVPKVSDLRTAATGLVNWYETATSTTVLAGARRLISGQTYYATQILNNCESTSRLAVKAIISVIAAPAAQATQSFCLSDNPLVANLQASATQLSWYRAASGGDPLSPQTPLISGEVYYASQTVTGCESVDRTAVTVTLIPTPEAPMATSQLSYCPTATASALTATALPGYSLLWYTTATGGTPERDAPVPDTAVPGIQTYYVSQQSPEGCESRRTAISVEIYRIPPLPLSGGNQQSCDQGQPLTLRATATVPDGFSIIWYNGAAEQIQDPVLNAPGTITYYAASKNIATGCVSAGKTAVTLTINPAPASPQSGGDLAECPRIPLQTLTATAIVPAGSIVVWYDAVTGGNAVGSPELNSTGSITYYAAAKDNNTGCESVVRTAVTLTLYPAITATLNLLQPTCANPTGTVEISSATASTFSITGTAPSRPVIVNGTGIFDRLQPGIYELIVQNSNGCTLTLPPVTISSPSCPEVTLSKRAVNSGLRKAGEIINYEFTVTNSGNVTLDNLRITDPGADIGSIRPATLSLSPGSSATATATHTLTQAEINSGSFSNQAAVAGTDPAGNPVTDPASDDPNTPAPDDPTVSVFNPQAAITLVKSATPAADGDQILYSFSIRNTGDLTLYSIQLSDIRLGLNKTLQTTLAPGETISDSFVYNITQADRNMGSVTNTALVTGQTPSATQISDISGTDETNDLPTVTELPSAAAISLVKTASITGNTITYTFRVLNSGKEDLNMFRLDDSKLGINEMEINLVLSAGETHTFSESYTLTQADRLLGRVTNTATISAKTQRGLGVEDISGTAVDNDMPTTINVPRLPVAVNDRAQTTANAAVVIDILANDDPVNSSFDKGSIVIVQQPRNGTVRINTNGTVTFTPAPGYTGEDLFSYVVKDLDGYQTNVAIVTINAAFLDLIIPNTFTPNGDGKNDVFEIVGLNQYEDNELTIINRWGSELYRKKDYQNTWTGDDIAEGTYFYLLKVKRKGSNNYEVLKGWILLKRAYRNQ